MAKPPIMIINADSSNESVVRFEDLEWKWVVPEKGQLAAAGFMFGGFELILQDQVPEDVKVEAMVNVADFKFSQWHFGDNASIRVAVLAEIDGANILRLFVDSNRDRKIQDSEEVTTKTANQKTWLVNLDAEVHDGSNTVHSNRQIGITAKRKADRLRITTIGYAEGQIELGDREVSVRRIDQDGNGLPTDTADQIWFDLNHDGEFDLVSERQRVNSFLNLKGTRYSLFSDRFGQSLKLSEASDVGHVKFLFDAKQKGAKIQRLEGCLRDESGLVIAIRMSGEATKVPPGKYCVENLLLEIRDKDDAVWRINLSRGIDMGYFDVSADSEHEIKLLESLKFDLAAKHQPNSNSGHLTHMQPNLYTPNGLVVSNLVCENSNALYQIPGRSDHPVQAKFDIEGTVDRDNRPLQGLSCYG